MTEYSMMIRTLDFVWMSYRGLHMFTSSLPEDSHFKSSNTYSEIR